jgi:hypothetical protein
MVATSEATAAIKKTAKGLKSNFISNAALEKKAKMLEAELRFQRSIRSAQADRIKLNEAEILELKKSLETERKEHNELKEIVDKVTAISLNGQLLQHVSFFKPSGTNWLMLKRRHDWMLFLI